MNIALNPRFLLDVQRRVQANTGVDGVLETVSALCSGQINHSIVVSDGQHRYFVKFNEARNADMFAAEQDALLELQRQAALRVPFPLGHGVSGNNAFLVLEHLELVQQGDAAALGAGLAALHGVTADDFGWHRDNTIGTSPQPNPVYQDWPMFWAEQRLGYQLERAATLGHPELHEMAAELLQKPAAFFDGYDPRPSLLHGDLWCGNFAYLAGGEPVIFDPATYYGDRETDLAMTELFGGFERVFYQAYEAHAPLDPGYAVRKHYYQLYHVLNHLNLFGEAYLARAGDMIERLLSEIR